MLNENSAIRTCLIELNKSKLIKFVTLRNESRIIRIITKLAAKQKRSDIIEILEFAGLTYDLGGCNNV